MDKKLKIIFVSTISLCLIIILVCCTIMVTNDTPTNHSSHFSFEESSDHDTNDSSSNSENVSDVFADNIENSMLVENQDIYHGWVINNIGYTYFYGDSAYEQFNFKNTALDRYINSINCLSECLPENTKMYNIIAPVSGSFADIPREVYVEDNFYNSSQLTFSSTVSSKLNDGVISVPIITQLEEQYDRGEYVFFRSDRNWTAIGAYTAYVEFCKASEINSFELNMFNVAQEQDFLGCFYNAATFDKNNEVGTEFADIFSNSPDKVIAFYPNTEIKTRLTVYDSVLVYDNYLLSNNSVTINNAYDIYLGKSAERYEINTTSGGGNLLIIGDTSAYPMAPFLAAHYSKIDIINPLKFKGDLKEFLSQRYYDDCICICYSTNAVNGEYIPNLNEIIGDNNG